MISLIKNLIFIIIAVIFSYYFSDTLTDKRLETIISSLTNISAAIFAISGLWISQVYPEALKAFSQNVSIVTGGDRAKRIEDLVLTISKSALVLILILLIQFIFPVIESFATKGAKDFYLSEMTVGLITFLALFQMSAVGSIMLHTYNFADELHNKNEEARAHKKFNE